MPAMVFADNMTLFYHSIGFCIKALKRKALRRVNDKTTISVAETLVPEILLAGLFWGTFLGSALLLK